jgi:hypothetical protein
MSAQPISRSTVSSRCHCNLPVVDTQSRETANHRKVVREENAESSPQFFCLSIEHRMPHIKRLFLDGKSTPEAGLLITLMVWLKFFWQS